MTNIALRNIEKKYGNIRALENISLDIQDGEFIALVGPSGSGKSSLLRVLAGLENTASGDIYFDGKRANKLPPKERKIVMISPSFRLYPDMKAPDENGMAFDIDDNNPCKGTHATSADDLINIEQLFENYPRRLFKNPHKHAQNIDINQQKAGILLFDEPLSNLDTAHKIEMRIEIAKLHRQLKATMIYVTPDQVEALTLADRIIVMNEGKIEQIGTSLDLYEKPANKFVAQFIGSPKMNFVPPQAEQLKISEQLLDDKTSLIGVRPEHISITSNESDFELSGTVEVVEQLGSDTIIYLNYGLTELFVIRLAGQQKVKIGDKVHCKFANADTLQFDKDGTRMRCPSANI